MTVETAALVPAAVHCDACGQTRALISARENAILHVHKHLLCPCGGTEVYVGSERLDEPAPVFVAVV